MNLQTQVIGCTELNPPVTSIKRKLTQPISQVNDSHILEVNESGKIILFSGDRYQLMKYKSKLGDNYTAGNVQKVTKYIHKLFNQ